eukprot:11160331-Lingulodinium_polyedra.AAC.1
MATEGILGPSPLDNTCCAHIWQAEGAMGVLLAIVCSVEHPHAVGLLLTQTKCSSPFSAAT